MIKKYLAVSKLVAILFVTIAFEGCGSEGDSESGSSTNPSKSEEVKTHTPETLQEVIADLEKDLLNPAAANHEAMAKQLVSFYQSYAQLFSQDSLAPEMLFRAGKQSVNLNDFKGALTYYSEVEKRYRVFQKRPECIYLQGFIYDTYLNEFGKAKEKYELVIEEYPKHDLAKQSEYSMQNLGMTEEDLIKSFEAKNKLD